MMLFTEQNKCFLNILKQNKCRSSKQLLKEGILSEVDAEDRDERGSSNLQCLWSYDLTALYKSVYYYYYDCSGWLIGGSERAEEGDLISPLKGNGQALEQKYCLSAVLGDKCDPSYYYYYSKSNCRRGTVQRARSVETMRNVEQMFVKLHLKSIATDEWPSRAFKVTGNGTNLQAIWHLLSVASIKNVSILHHFWDTSTLTFTVYMTAC